jgi:putative sterol carrier protein
MLLFLRATIDTAAAAGIHDLYELHVDDEVFHVMVDDGRVDARAGAPPRRPDLVVRTDLETFAAIGAGSLVVADAADRVQVEGDAEVARRCLRLLAPAALAEPVA